MPPHLRELDRQCDAPGCERRAVVGLYNTYNRHLGDYCRRCGRANLRALRRADHRKVAAGQERPRVEQIDLVDLLRARTAGAGSAAQ